MNCAGCQVGGRKKSKKASKKSSKKQHGGVNQYLVERTKLMKKIMADLGMKKIAIVARLINVYTTMAKAKMPEKTSTEQMVEAIKLYDADTNAKDKLAKIVKDAEVVQAREVRKKSKKSSKKISKKASKKSSKKGSKKH